MSQDYSGQNLRGRSFKGQNLEGANFSGADIRGANFTGANLRGANFSHAKAGLQNYWAIVFIIILWLFSVLLGFFSGSFGYLAERMLESDLRNQDAIYTSVVSGVLALIVFASVFVATIFRGIGAGFRYAAVIALGAIVLLIATLIVSTFTPIFTDTSVSTGSSDLVSVTGTFKTIGPFISYFSAVLTACLPATIAIATTAFGAVTIATVFFVAEFGAVAVAVTTAIIFAVVFSIPAYSNVATTLSFSVILLSVYIGLQSTFNNKKYLLIRTISIGFAATGGTSFSHADLTDTNFTVATLKSTDFRNATLIRTCFHQVKMLDRVRPEKTYLQNPQLRHLLVTGQGQDNNFDRQDLRGINLERANLADASFIGTDLSKANLKDADLSRAKLVQAQLDGTDFTGATLTGAYIQDWGITTDTKFDGVRCEYIYMRLPTKENPDPLRKPDNHKEVFADGEFGDFIQPIFDTLDLYHNQGVDPRAIATAFKELAENNPNAELEIVAIERRGEDKILLRAKTATTANKSDLSKEYFINYNQLKALAEKDFKATIAEKNIQIRRLENMILTALERPSFYANKPIIQGDITVAGDRNINTGGGNYNERIERDYIQGNYYAAGQPQSLAQAAAEIQLLLKQLEQTYPTTTTSQQMVVAAEAINRIESNPLLKERVINAVKGGGLAAFEKAIDNPAGAFIVGAIKGWQEVEAED